MSPAPILRRALEFVRLRIIGRSPPSRYGRRSLQGLPQERRPVVAAEQVRNRCVELSRGEPRAELGAEEGRKGAEVTEGRGREGGREEGGRQRRTASSEVQRERERFVASLTTAVVKGWRSSRVSQARERER